MIKFNILISPLDWGLGHTTRIVPIIKLLQKNNYNVVVAVNENQKKILSVELQNVEFADLQGYNIVYAKNKILFLLKLFFQIPKILCSIYKENKWLKNFVKNHKVDFVVSDNRYGFYHKKIPSIFITHQLQIQTGNKFLNNLLQKINYRFIEKFKFCWIPDVENKNGLSGNLSHPQKLPSIPIRYIGLLSRFLQTKVDSKALEIKFDYCVLISGPEPQRTLFELKIIEGVNSLKHQNGIIFRGLPNHSRELEFHSNCIIKNHASSKEIVDAILQSKYVICRSGYTSLMELVSLKKKLIVVPTPYQTEQEYLAKYLQSNKLCLAFDQKSFSLINAIQQAQRFEFNTAEFGENNLHIILNDLK